MQLAIVDNHDSFTFNLVEVCRQVGFQEITVMKNDQLDYSILDEAKYILLSPGPGLPSETLNLKQIIIDYSNHASILGICLGFQAIVEVYGGALRRLNRVQHGVVSLVSSREGTDLFEGIDTPFPVGSYHSWIADTIPECLEVTAWTEGIIMGVRHKQLNVQGVQFHPESILTPGGKQMIQNWLNSRLITR